MVIVENMKEKVTDCVVLRREVVVGHGWKNEGERLEKV